MLWLLNTSGTRVGAYKYAPYGGTTATGAAAVANRFRWIGAQQDTKAAGGDGHYKLGARYYNTNGQFTQPDPVAGGLSDPRTLTGYNYSGGDPINQADPSGRAFDDIVGKALGAASDLASLAAGCEKGLGSYGADRSCNSAVNGFVGGAIVAAGCAATTALTAGAAALVCGTAALGGSIGASAITEAAGRIVGVGD